MPKKKSKKKSKKEKSILELIEELSADELVVLDRRLRPALEARKEYMDYVHIQIPADLQILEKIEAERRPLLKSNKADDVETLAKLDRRLAKIKMKIEGRCEDGWRIGGHEKTRIKFHDLHQKASEKFRVPK